MTKEEFIAKVLAVGYSEEEANKMIKDLELDSQKLANYCNQDASSILSDLLQMICPSPKQIY